MGASRRQGLQLDVTPHGVTSGTTAIYRRHVQGGGSHRCPRMESPPSTAGQEEQELRERAFFSWAEFSRFFDAGCQQRLALFFVKSSMHLARCRWASAPPLYTLIDVLKYSYVRLVCKDVRAPSRPTVGCVRGAVPCWVLGVGMGIEGEEQAESPPQPRDGEGEMPTKTAKYTLQRR
uniref:Uncharacterized protein C19orf68 n=1 Tax=Neovison vison TaxID=452646 RepID=U6CTK9_NEOVI